MNRIEELEKQAKEILEEIEKLKKEEKVESKFWKPQREETYFLVRTNGKIDWNLWADDEWDKTRYAIGNCFKTQEEAEKALEKLKIYTQLKRLAEEENTELIDWKNENQKKYYIGYSYCYEELEQGITYTFKEAGTIYSTSKNFLDIAKQHIGEENLLKLFKE